MAALDADDSYVVVLRCSSYPPSLFGLWAQFSPRNILIVDADANKAAGDRWPSLYWRVGLTPTQRLLSAGVKADAWRMSSRDGSIPLAALGEMAAWCGLPTVWHVGSSLLLLTYTIGHTSATRWVATQFLCKLPTQPLRRKCWALVRIPSSSLCCKALASVLLCVSHATHTPLACAASGIPPR